MDLNNYFFYSWIFCLCGFVVYLAYISKQEIVEMFGYVRIPQLEISKREYKKKEVEDKWKEIVAAMGEDDIGEESWKMFLEIERAQKAVIENRIKILEIIGNKKEFRKDVISKSGFSSFYVYKTIPKKPKKVWSHIDEIAKLEAMAGHIIVDSDIKNLQ